jgi:hypothetical protein
MSLELNNNHGTEQELTMQVQNSAQPEYLPTHCGHCGAHLPVKLERSVCPSCQSLVPITRRVTMFFEAVGADEGRDGVRVGVGGAATVVFWNDFAGPNQLWGRVGELAQLVWKRWPDIADRMEADPADEIDSEDSVESRSVKLPLAPDIAAKLAPKSAEEPQ